MPRKIANLGAAVGYSLRLPIPVADKVEEVSATLGVSKNALIVSVLDHLELDPDGVPPWWDDYVNRPKQGQFPIR